MIHIADPIDQRDAKRAVSTAIVRIQHAVRATEVPPDVLPFQPGAWLVSWPAIAALWAIAGALCYACSQGWIN